MRYLITSLALCLACACSNEPKTGVQAASKNTTTTDPYAKTTGKEVTAMDQSNVQADVDLTARVRRALVDDSALSVGAKNITVVSKSGAVTLRGNVASAAERSSLKSLVDAVEGVNSVDDQLQIAP